ncbi:MAG: NADH-quinone oxidoreductase subunit N [Chloroflexi bacterium]|nr:NADH-quinone oxidoreductase subunit N [Chloroflexota bacterium]
MSARDLLLVSPELALVVLAVAIVLLDLVLDRKGFVLAVGIAGLAVPLAAAVGLWTIVADGGPEMAFHGALVIDAFAIFFKLLIVGTLGLLLLSSAEYIERFSPHQAEFVALVLLSAAGLMLLAAAADLIAVFVSLELASLPVVALVAFSKSGRSIEAGIKYLLLSGLSSAVLLYGFAFLYGATGTVRLVALDPALPTIATMLPAAGGALPFGSLAVLVGVVLATAGFGFKLSMVPFQMWTPDVYEGAPTPVAAFLATASKAAAFAIVLRLFYTALGGASADWSVMFAVLAALTMTVGNVVAIAQSNVKRLLGYSAIAQAGYMLIGVAAIASEGGSGPLGIESVLFYLGGYAAMNLAAFFAVIAITNATGDDRIEALAGVGRRTPLLALVLAFALISLTGIPPTVGFMGKLFLFNAAVSADLAWLAVVGVLNSVVSAYYYMGIVRTMYMREPAEPRRIGAPVTAWVAMGVATAGVAVLGVWPAWLLDIARTAAGSLVP